MAARLPIQALLLIGALGCAAKVPLQSESPAAAIRSAEELGAARIPEAALHLQLAKEEMQAAVDLHEAGRDEQANSLLLRAESDAELAIALARVEAERVAALSAMEKVRKLRAENPYDTGGVE